MKLYEKPYIEDELIEIEDICGTSGGTTENGVEVPFPEFIDEE